MAWTYDFPQNVGQPPVPREEDGPWARETHKWLERLGDSLARRGETTDRAINGNIEFPYHPFTPHGDKHGGNIKLVYKTFDIRYVTSTNNGYDCFDVAFPYLVEWPTIADASGNTLDGPHGFFVYQWERLPFAHAGTGVTQYDDYLQPRVLDTYMDSNYFDPQTTSRALPVNGFRTVDVTAGSQTVTGSNGVGTATWPAVIEPGDYIQFYKENTPGGDNRWHLIIDDAPTSTTLTLADPVDVTGTNLYYSIRKPPRFLPGSNGFQVYFRVVTNGAPFITTGGTDFEEVIANGAAVTLAFY